jgi:hypothetical protein
MMSTRGILSIFAALSTSIWYNVDAFLEYFVIAAAAADLSEVSAEL